MTTNPFKGLKAFTADDATEFWGREQEIGSLLAQVCATKVLLLYGKSGVGKTSLLQAGLGPTLRRNDYFPVTVRIHEHLIASVQDQVIEALEKRQINLARHTRTLAELFEDVTSALRETNGDNAEDIPVVLVVDQFEDFFGSFSQNGVEVERREFTRQLAELVYRRGLSVSVLISLREDFLPELSAFRSTIPSIFGNYYRLGPLPDREARRAIVQPLVGTSIAFSDDLVETLLHDLQEEENVGVEPYALQMVCSHIWHEWNERGPIVPLTFYREELGGLQSVLGGFIEKRIGEFPPRNQTVIKRIFPELFTARGRGRLVHVASLYDLVKEDVPSEEVLRKEVLEPLDRDYRLITIRSLRNVLYCEPIHDTLSRKAGEWREELDKKRLELRVRNEHTARRKKRRFFGILGGIAVVALAALAFWVARYKAQSAAVELNAQLRTADSTREVGYGLLINKNYPAALEKFQLVLPAYRKLHDERRETRALIDIGRVHVFTGETSRARATLDSATTLAQRTRDRVAQGEILERLATLSERDGNMVAALPLYEKSQEAYKSGGDLQASARIGERLAQQAERDRDYSKAEQAYREALESYTTAGDHVAAERVRIALAQIAAMHAPWGFLSDLQTAQVYPLVGSQMEVGRNAPSSGVVNDIGFLDKENLVSRRHLIFRRNLTVEDQRSRNGTSVNGQMLSFGFLQPLSDGDILVLAGIKPLQFTIGRPNPARVPSNAWAILIDGAAHQYRYLTASAYSISVINGRIELQPALSTTSQIQIRWENGKPELLDTPDGWSVAFMTKEADYDYKSYELSSGKWIDISGIGPLEYVRVENGTIVEKGPAFQIVLLVTPEN